jgi:Zn-dependent protease
VLVGLVITIAFGPILAFAVSGKTGFTDWIKITFDARSQNLVSESVWGAPKLLFTRSGLAHPLLVSAPMRDVATLLLAAWVIAVLTLTLRWGDSSVLCFWNVVACVVLLLPISHFDYTLYLLPILWIWWARWLATFRVKSYLSVISGLLTLWWLVLSHTYWDQGLSTTSSLHYVVPFVADLLAVTISIFGDHRLRANSGGEVTASPHEESSSTVPQTDVR